MSNPFGPENTKVYVVDLETGQISDYMTSADEADCDKYNGDCFLNFKDAHDKGMEIIVASGGGLLDMTDYQEEEAMMNSTLNIRTEDVEEAMMGLMSKMMKVSLRPKLRLSVAKELIKQYKETGSTDNILQHVEVSDLDDEFASIEAFIEWINDNAFQGCLTSQKELCRYYKDVFIPEVNNK